MNGETGSTLRIRLRACAFALVTTLAAVSNGPGQILPNSVVVDEFNGSTIGQPYGITYVPTPFGEGAVFSRAADSRIEYRVPPEGTLEWWIKVSSGYYYSNFQLNADQAQAMIFSTDAQGGDVTWPGAAKLFVHANGEVSLYIAISKYDKPPAPQVIAKETPFRFNQWHSIGISYGSQGEYIMVDGNLVASAQVGQLLDAAGNHQQPLDVPTIGETVSHFWAWHQYSGGFNGIVARFRASTAQRDWVLSASAPTPPPMSNSGNATSNFAGTWQATQQTFNGEDRPVTGMRPFTITQTGSLEHF